MNTKLRRLTGALTLAIAMMLAIMAAPAFAQGPVDLSVAKSVDNPTPASGDTVVYTVQVTNTSLITDATGVTLTDNLPSGVTYVSDNSSGAYTGGVWNIGPLVTNTTQSLLITATVTAADGTVVSNTASVTGAETDPNTANNTASVDITVTNPPPPPAQADLSVAKSVDNPTPASGGQIVYTIVITNNGPDAATGVVVTDTLPAGVSWVSDDSAGAYVPGTGVWTVAPLANGATATLNITADVTAANGTLVTNTANVGGNEVDNNGANDSASVDITVTNPPPPPAQADLGVSKAVDNPTPASGGQIVYTIVITNNGPDAATGVVVTDTLPAGVSWVSDDSAGVYVPGTGVWTVAPLANGATATLNITADVTAANGAPPVTNTANVGGNEIDNNGTNDSASVDINVTNPLPPPAQVDLSVAKRVDNPTPASGDTVVYTVQVTNTSLITDATGVVVTDTLPAGVTYVSDDGSGTYDSGTGVWTIGTLVTNTTVALNITTMVDAAPDGTVVSNSASVTAVETDPNPANNTASVDITVTVQAILIPKPVTVTVTSAGGAAVPNQLVQVHTVDTNGIGTTATTISDTTNISGTVTFSLLDDSYKFFAGDAFGSYSSDVCNVPTCTTASLFMFTPVEITVVDTTGADVAGQDVYVFDNANTYQNISDTTNISGSVSFDLNSNNYLFWTYDANGAAYGSVPAPCTTPDCATAVITMPVFGMVDVTVTDGLYPVGGKNVQVYTVDTNGITSATTISAPTNITGTVTFTLAEGPYQFGGVVSGTTYLSATCNVPTCTTSSLILAAVSPVTVTVQDSVGNPLENQVVTVFDDVAGLATPVTGTTNISGTINFNLPDGDYRFTADGIDGITYFSTSGGNPVCTVPGCTDALLTLPAAAVTLPDATCTETSPGNRTCDLWATTGLLTLPDGTTLPFWGYSDTATGPAQLPGPMLIVNQGENVTVNLHNTLPEDSALLFKGMDMVPDLTGAAANGGTATYTLDTSKPGTFQYQAGLILNGNGNRQTALGMAGALVIRPVNGVTPVLDQAYDAKSQFDDETLLVLGEVDPDLNNSLTSLTSFNMRDFQPKYWLINGKAYPDTTLIQTVAGHKVLLRYVNTGLNYHSMGVLGQVQTLHAVDGEPRPGGLARNVQSETVSPGQTMDVIVSVPSTVTPDTRFAVYDTSMLLHNSNADGYGGMMTFLSTLPDNTLGNPGGPITLDVTLTPDSTVGGVDVAMVGQVSDVTTGGDDIQVAEYFIGAPGTPGTGTALNATDGAYNSPTEDVDATIPGTGPNSLESLGSGNFTIYVDAQDVLGNWGAFHPVVLHLDKDGPASTGLELSPNPGGGNGTVKLTATGDDRFTGNSDVVAARYTVGGNTLPMNVNVTAPIVGLTADVDVNTLAEGIHTVSVESQDSFGHWGNPGTIDLMVDKTGPDTVSVALLPSANNGFLPVNPSLFSMRVNATISDTVSGGVLSNIHQAEGFIDTVGADGTGFPLTPADGQYNSTGEDGYAFIPLSTVNRLTEGVHTIYIHGQDASGNWGAVVGADLTIDKTPPAVSGLIANPNPTNSAPTTALAATATDAATAINRAEWFEGADPGQGNGMPMFIASNGPAWDITSSIDLTGWANGDYVIWARARDAAGNWSQAISTTLTVAEAPTPVANQLYFSTLGGGNNNPVQNVNRPFDDADIYHWDGLIGGNAFDRLFDGTAAGLVGHADIDGVKVDLVNGLYYMSFNRNAGTAVPTLGGVGDEDIVVVDTLNNNEWNLEFEGIKCGLNGTNGREIDAFDIVGGVIYFSTVGNDRVNTAGTDNATNALGGPYDDADIYMWNGVECSRFWDARSGAGNFLPGNADIDGLTIVDNNTFYMSFNRGTTNVPGLGSVRDEDVVLFDNGTWSLFFDGSARDLNNGGQDVDAVDVKW